MAPTEASILSDFLLSPAALPTIIPMNKFTELFPKGQRSHPQVKLLYRELQHLRATDIGIVKENIAKEITKGARQMTSMHKAWSAGRGDVNGANKAGLDIDVKMFGATSNLPSAQAHTISSMLSELDRACSDLEKELEETQPESESVLEHVQTAVGELSDLRYGKLGTTAGSRRTVGTEVADGLRRLEEACQSNAMEE